MNTTGRELIRLTFFGEDGEVVHLTDFEVQPFSYEDLERATSDGPASEFTILRNVKILKEDGSEAFSDRKRVRIDGPTYPSFLVALVFGGWLPAAWAERHLMLLDSNVFTHLTGRFQNGSIKDHASPDLSDLFVNVPIRVNYLLSALEGCRRIPTENEVARSLMQARKRLTNALPTAIIHPPDLDVALRGVMGIIRNTTQSMEAEIRFIRACAPKVARSPNPKAPLPWNAEERIGILKEVIAEAEAQALTLHSGLCVLALLGCLVGPCGNAAIKLVKPNDIHEDGNAYNAWFDLHSLRVFIALSADEPQTKMAIVTGDRGMARFWAALGVHDARAVGVGVNFKANPNPSLFAFTDEEWTIANRWLRG